MNQIINQLLLAAEKFRPEMHLRQPGFTYRACEPFTKNKERTQKFQEAKDPRYIFHNELNKVCFQHYVAYGDFKNLRRRTSYDNILRDKAFNIAKNPKYNGYQGGLASLRYRFFDKKSLLASRNKFAGSGVKIYYGGDYAK